MPLAGAAGIPNAFGIGHLLVVDAAPVSLAQQGDPFGLALTEHEILVCMRLLVRAREIISHRLVFRALATPLRPIQDQVQRFAALAHALGYPLGIAFRAHAQVLQGLLQHGQEAMNPCVGLRLTHVKDLTEQDLERVGFEIDQGEQEFLFRRGEGTRATATGFTLTGGARQGFRRGIAPGIRSLKRGQYEFEFFGRESGERQELPPIRFDSGIREHALSVFLISDKVY